MPLTAYFWALNTWLRCLSGNSFGSEATPAEGRAQGFGAYSRAPNIVEPTLTLVDPISMACSKSPDMPMLSSSSATPRPKSLSKCGFRCGRYQQPVCGEWPGQQQREGGRAWLGEGGVKPM